MPAKSPASTLFRIAPGQIVHATSDLLDSQRFLRDVDYLSHFAGKLGACLGMRRIELGFIEDARSQTAFYYTTSPDGIGKVVNGIFSTACRPPSQIVQDLQKE